MLVNRQCHLGISWRAFKSTNNWAPTPSAFLTGLEAMVMLLAWGPSVCCDHSVTWGVELPWNPGVCLQSGPHRHLFPLLVLLCFVLNAPQMVLMPTEVEIPTASPLTLTQRLPVHSLRLASAHLPLHPQHPLPGSARTFFLPCFVIYYVCALSRCRYP